MFRIKRLYTFMLQTFLPLFAMTFGICLFIVLLQFLWRYIDDLVGKGLSIVVLGEMLLYAALSLIPMALPLAILLASLMTFGNLGERLELLAMKSAGISLIHIMRPLIVTLTLISISAFFFQNNVTPVSQVKLYTLLYSIRQKSPELDIPESVFYSEIPGYNVYVKKKDKVTGLLRDVMIYDYSNGFDNAQIIVADSGILKTSADKLFLVLTLFDGESFDNIKNQGGARSKGAVPYKRETFKTKETLIPFDANFSRMDESFMENQYIGKDIHNLRTSIDSMTVLLDSANRINANAILADSYRKDVALTPVETEALKNNPEREHQALPILRFDSLYQQKTPATKSAYLDRAIKASEATKTDYYFKSAMMSDNAAKIRRHEIELHKKFTLSFACFMFFFIGAPLGAIIRKGGLGLPVVLSVIIFIIYYIIDNIGFKMARDGVWEIWEGVWLSSFILTPLGLFLTYKAVNDSVILDADTYINALKNLLGKRPGRNIQRKEIIMLQPDYPQVHERLQQLTADCSAFLSHNKRWVSYFSFWKRSHKDDGSKKIAFELDQIVDELGNSDQNLMLAKLMDYPVIAGYTRHTSPLSGWTSLLAGILFPVGVPIYLLAMYQRRFLIHDIQTIVRVNSELNQIINDHLESKTI